jgi:hypothetical protein
VTVEAVRITARRGRSYFAELDTTGPKGRQVIPCRPSDALALVLRQRMPTPVLVAEWVFDPEDEAPVVEAPVVEVPVVEAVGPTTETSLVDGSDDSVDSERSVDNTVADNAAAESAGTESATAESATAQGAPPDSAASGGPVT